MTNHSSIHHCDIDPKGRFTLWPLALTLVALIWVCLGLNHFAASRAMPDLYCESELHFQPENKQGYTVSSIGSPIQNKQLTLDLSYADDQVLLIFKYLENNKLIGNITFDGKLLGLEVTSMTYKLLLDKHDVELMIDKSQLPLEIQRLIASEPSSSRKPQHLPIDIQVLELSPETGHGIIQLKPSNNLWDCQIST